MGLPLTCLTDYSHQPAHLSTSAKKLLICNTSSVLQYADVTDACVSQHMHRMPCQADLSFALAASYGNRAFEVTKIAEERKLGKRLARGYPMLEAEVTSCATTDVCCHLCSCASAVLAAPGQLR